MRKSFLVVAIAVALLVATAVPGVAKPGNGAEAVHFDELRCGVEWFPVDDFGETILDPECKVHNVRTGNGAYHLTLHGQIPDEFMDDFVTDGAPKTFEGGCLANYGFIVDRYGEDPSGWPVDWRDDIAVFTTSVRRFTPDGKMTEVCHYKPEAKQRVDKVTGTYTYFVLENPSQWRTVSVSAHATDPVKGTWEWITPSGTWSGPITCLRVSEDEAWLAGKDWDGPGGVFMYLQDGGTPGRNGDTAFTWHTDLGETVDEVEPLCEEMALPPWFGLYPWPVVSGNLNVWDAS